MSVGMATRRGRRTPGWWQDREMGRVRQWLSRLRDPLPFRANARCPICSSPVVLLPTTYLGSQYTSPMMVRRTREERVAACPTHGRSPFNDLSVKAASDQRRIDASEHNEQ